MPGPPLPLSSNIPCNWLEYKSSLGNAHVHQVAHGELGCRGRWEFSFFSNYQWECWFILFHFRPSGSTKGHGEDTFFSPAPAIPPSSFQLMGHVTQLCAGFLANISVSLCHRLQGPGCVGWHCLSHSIPCGWGVAVLWWEFVFPWNGVLLLPSSPAHWSQHPLLTAPRENPARDSTFPVSPFSLVENSYSHRAQASYLSERCCQDDGSCPIVRPRTFPRASLLFCRKQGHGVVIFWIFKRNCKNWNFMKKNLQSFKCWQLIQKI